MSDPRETYNLLNREMSDVAMYESIVAVLGYDEQTVMAEGASVHRADQTATIEGLRHEKLTSSKINDYLSELEDSNYEWGEETPEAVNIREWRRDYDRAVKLPRDLVEQLTTTSVYARNSWAKARNENSYRTFQPWLERIFKLQLRIAEAFGYEDEPYDALLDKFEPGVLTRDVAAQLAKLRDGILPLMEQVRESGKLPASDALSANIGKTEQMSFIHEMTEALGFDKTRGSIGETTHPFCITLGPNDVRITARHTPNDIEGILLAIHETGHAIYEQHLPTEHYGTPIGTYCSMGIHESQSRFWENRVGRSEAFWRNWYPRLAERFNEFKERPIEEFLFALNAARPSLIRVGADEITYNLHVLLRFEIERALLNGDLPFKDLPDAWNSAYNNYLSINPPNHRLGCLQDVHWALGSVGYFPTYALGNIYSAQFAHQAEKEIGSIDELVQAENYKNIQDWFKNKVHLQGRRFLPAALVSAVTDEAPNADYLIGHLRARVNKYYF